MDIWRGKEKFKDYIIGVLISLALILMIASKWIGKFQYFIIVFIALIEVIEILDSVKKYKEKTLRLNVVAIWRIFLRVMLAVLMLISWYEILLSKDYNLKYAYWIAFLSVTVEFIILDIRKNIKIYKDGRLDNKKYNFINCVANVVVSILLLAFVAHNFALSYFQPSHQIALDNLKTPEVIEIYRYEKNQSDNPFANPIAQITSQEDIEKIIKEMELIKAENITSTDMANYKRMKDNNYPYYQISFGYDNVDEDLKKLKNGYIADIIITSNRVAVIQNLSKRAGLMGTEWYYEVYPISLSRSTMDMIFSYIKTSK